MQAGHRYGEGEPSGTGAPRVQKQDSVPVLDAGLVGVATDHGVEPRGPRIEVEVGHVVENVQIHFSHPDSLNDRKHLRPKTSIGVPPHRDHARDFPELFKDLRISNIARVDYQVRVLECRDRFGSQQPMCVRYNPNDMLSGLPREYRLQQFSRARIIRN